MSYFKITRIIKRYLNERLKEPIVAKLIRFSKFTYHLSDPSIDHWTI